MDINHEPPRMMPKNFPDLKVAEEEAPSLFSISEQKAKL